MKNKRKNKVRLNLLLIPTLFALIIVANSCQPGNSGAKVKPNIILIFTDQQNSKTLSAAGNPYLHTPAMDFLAQHGVMFSNAYCTSPVCGPSRSSIISGRMPHETGVEWNGQSMKPDITNAGEIFRKSGYNTVWAGKWHLPESYPQQPSARHKEIKGFDLLPFDPERKRWFLGAETDAPLTKAVVNYLKEYDHQKPLFLAVSYHNPHDICMYPRKAGWVSEDDSLLEIRYYGFKYKLPDVIGTKPGDFKTLPPLPPNFAINENEPGFITEKRKHHNEYGVETKLSNQEFGDLEWKGYLNAYYRLTEKVDKEIGKVLDALKENGYSENTLLIFTSDHGDGAAAHKWAAKLSLYEESSKVPFILSWPGKIPEGLVDCRNLVSLTDILPTMIDYSGTETNLTFTGKSLKPIIDNPVKKGRDYLVVELADFTKKPSRKGRMVRFDKFKYNIYSTDEEQLFHVGNDPGETQNLVSEPTLSGIRSQCRQYLSEWAEATKDTFAINILKNK